MERLFAYDGRPLMSRITAIPAQAVFFVVVAVFPLKYEHDDAGDDDTYR